MKRYKKPKRAFENRGTAAVEFAILCPLLLTFSIACTDLGRIAHVYQVVAAAARTGAEIGATKQLTAYTQPTWEARIQTAILNEMSNLSDFDESKLDVELTSSTDSQALTRVSLSLEYSFTPIVAWPGLPSETVLRKSVEFRQFR